jgi:molybdopterin synthase catalytic subunit
MVKLTHEPIDTAALVNAVQTPEVGAVVLFLGVSRRLTQGRETTQLTYDAYEKMAVKELELLEAEARQRWPIVSCAIVHRLGVVPLGEASVAVAVACPHRREAFEAGQWLIDTLKERVPIWKQEHWADGKTEWVHPERVEVE